MQLSRREFFREAGLFFGSLFIASMGINSHRLDATTDATSSEHLRPQDVPTVFGWSADRKMSTGLFSVDLSSNEGRRNVFLTAVLPEYLYSQDYDRFVIVQLIRSFGGNARSFFARLGQEVNKSGIEVVEQSWLKMLRELSPDVEQKWKAVGFVPSIDLSSEQKGRTCVFDIQKLNEPLPGNSPVNGKTPTFLDIPQDRQTIYWMIRAKNNTIIPLDQGDLGGSGWFSRWVGQDSYENWKVVATGNYNAGNNPVIGPEGSLPYIGPNPIFYKSVGTWVDTNR